MKKITICDYRFFKYGKDRNGGSYIYSETAVVSDDGSIVSGEHSCSSDFYYCPNCGHFENDPHHNEWCKEYVPSGTMEDYLLKGLLPEGIQVRIEEYPII